MMPYCVGDHVLLKASDSSLENHNDWVVVHLEGSTLMLKRGHQVICGVHADEVAPRLSRTRPHRLSPWPTPLRRPVRRPPKLPHRPG